MTTSNIIYLQELLWFVVQDLLLTCTLQKCKRLNTQHACKKISITLFKFIPFRMTTGHFVSSHLSLLFAFQLYISAIKIRMQENQCWIIWNTITLKCYEPLKIQLSLSFYFNQHHQILSPQNKLAFL